LTRFGADAGDGWLERSEIDSGSGSRSGYVLRLQPGDERAVEIVHRIVPAVLRGQLRTPIVIPFAIDDLLAGFFSEDFQGEAAVGLAKEGLDQIADEDLRSTLGNHLALPRGGDALFG